MTPPPIKDGDAFLEQPVLGRPVPLQQAKPLAATTSHSLSPDVPDTYSPWLYLAALFIAAVSVNLIAWAIPDLSSAARNADAPRCSPGCSSDPWATTGATSVALHGNQTRFIDPAWQKQQASQLLSDWGFSSGKRSFVAVAGAQPACASSVTCCARPGCAGCVYRPSTAVCWGQSSNARPSEDRSIPRAACAALAVADNRRSPPPITLLVVLKEDTG